MILDGIERFHNRQIRYREYKRAVCNGMLGAVGRGDATPWVCDVCARVCRGRIGLVAHQRTHVEPPAKRVCQK